MAGEKRFGYIWQIPGTDVAKQAVIVAQAMAVWRYGERLGNSFEGSKKML